MSVSAQPAQQEPCDQPNIASQHVERTADPAGVTAKPSSSSVTQADILPVVEERAEIRKQLVETDRVSVNVTPRVDVRDVPLDTMREELHVERVAINRYVDQPPATRQEGNVTVIPVLEEVLVVEKRLLLKEEVRITKRQHVETERRRVELRRDKVEIVRGDVQNEQTAS